MEVDNCKSDIESGAWAAFRTGDLDLIRHLIDSKANFSVIDDDGNRPILLAARYGHLEALKLALASGIDVIGAVNYHGEGVSLLAAIGGHLDILEWFYSLDKDLERRNNEQRTALHCASLHGHTALVEWLLNHHCDINALDSTSLSPILLGAQAEHTGVVSLLLRNGAALPTSFPIVLSTTATSILDLLFTASLDMEFCDWSVSAEVLACTILGGKLETVRWMFASGKLSAPLIQESLSGCWIGGQLEILDFFEKDCRVTSQFSEETLANILRACQHLPTLRRLVDIHTPISSQVRSILMEDPAFWLKRAVADANTEKVEWLLSLLPPSTMSPELVTPDVIQSLLSVGGEKAEKMLDWLDSRGVRWKYKPPALQQALFALNPQGPCLVERLLAPSRGCTSGDLQKMEYPAITAAAASGNLESVKWILSLKLPDKLSPDQDRKDVDAIAPVRPNKEPTQTQLTPFRFQKALEFATTSPNFPPNKSPVAVAAKYRHWDVFLFLDKAIPTQGEWRAAFRFDHLPPLKVFSALCKRHSEEEVYSAISNLNVFNQALEKREYDVAAYCLELTMKRGGEQLEWLRNSVWRGIVKDDALSWFVNTRKIDIAALFETIDARRYGQSMWWGAAANGNFAPLEWAQTHGYWPGRVMTAQIEADIAQARVAAALNGNREATLRLWSSWSECGPSFDNWSESGQLASNHMEVTLSPKRRKDIAESFLVLLDRDVLGRLQPSIVKDLIHIIGVPINYLDRHGRTSLHYAASSGNYEVIKCLLKAGATMIPAKDGATPIMISARKEDTEAMDLFVEAGATLMHPGSAPSDETHFPPVPVHDAHALYHLPADDVILLTGKAPSMGEEPTGAHQAELREVGVSHSQMEESSPNPSSQAYNDEILESLLEKASPKVLEWANKNGFPIPPSLMERAISLGHQPAQTLVDQFLKDGKQLPLQLILSGLSRRGDLLEWLLDSHLFSRAQVSQYCRLIASVAFHSDAEGVKILQLLKRLHIDIPSSLVAANLPAILNSFSLFDWICGEDSESMRPRQDQVKFQHQAGCVLRAMLWKNSDKLLWLHDACHWDFSFLRGANPLIILEAIENSAHIDNLKFLVPSVFDARALDEATDYFGENPVMAAVRQQKIDVTKWLLLEIGCSSRVICENMSLVDMAASVGNLELTKFLLEEVRVPLDLAFPNDDESEDPAHTVLEHACLNGTNLELMSYLFDKTEAFRPHLLHHAFVRLLQGDVDRDGTTTWLWFIEQKHFSVHKFYFRNQYTPFLAAMYSMRIERLEKLFELGSRLSERTGFLFYDAVTIAAGLGWIEGLKWLLRRGCGTSNRDFYGWTPLHHAASADHLGAFQYLVSRGCSLSALSTEGRSALSTGLGNPLIGPWLLEHGFADPNALFAENNGAHRFEGED